MTIFPYVCKKYTAMINEELIRPRSIVVVGGSNKTSKPGGNCVRNLINGKYEGELYVVNAKETEVQGVKSYPSVSDIPDTDLPSFLFRHRHALKRSPFSQKKKVLKLLLCTPPGLAKKQKKEENSNKR